jgi:tRNA (adenine57-N1/adenine58-N1)-methyltransferase
MSDLIKNGSYVLIFLDGKRNWIREVKEDGTFHSNKGQIQYNDLIGTSYGRVVKSHSGIQFQIHKPSLTDIQTSMGKKTRISTNIVYPKDAGIILIESSIGAGSEVVEAGTGSGALTFVLANAVGSTGKVYTYEAREDIYQTAKMTLEKYTPTKNIIMHNKDILEGVEEKDVDAVVLDLATPWEVVEHAFNALKPSHYFASYSPTINQVMKTHEALSIDGQWGMLKTLEVLQREIRVKPNATRPKTWMVAHTGYMTFARKLYDGYS